MSTLKTKRKKNVLIWSRACRGGHLAWRCVGGCTEPYRCLHALPPRQHHRYYAFFSPPQRSSVTSSSHVPRSPWHHRSCQLPGHGYTYPSLIESLCPGWRSAPRSCHRNEWSGLAARHWDVPGRCWRIMVMHGTNGTPGHPAVRCVVLHIGPCTSVADCYDQHQ